MGRKLEKLKAFSELIRIKETFFVFVSVLATILLCQGNVFNWKITLPALLAIIFIAAGGNMINDSFDFFIDLVNRPDRPLPSGRFSRKNAKRLSFVLFFIGIFFSLFLPLLSIVIACFTVVLLIFYSYFFKRSGFLGNFFVSYMFASIFVAVAATTPNLMTGIFIGILAFFTSSAHEILKDMEDVRGDKIGGVKTLPINHGIKKTNFIVFSFLLIAILFTPIPYFLGLVSFYYLFVIFIADLVFVKVILSVLRSSYTNPTKNVNLILFGVGIVFLAFFAGLL
jgi:geranylgeranylglycerol-phosphate geranylgeranyltransferase